MLDSVIDFFSYIIIPSVMIYWFKLVPVNFEFIIPSIILIISAISYSNSNVMTSDNVYKGFPCVWNILVFYLYIFDFSQIINLLLISIFIVLKFIPIKYIHPLRVKKYKKYNENPGLEPNPGKVPHPTGLPWQMPTLCWRVATD